jgi:hypothetical protein
MNIDQLHEQMDREAIRLADHLFAYCDVDPHSTLAGKVRDLEVGELVALFYLIAHERLLPEDALTQFTRVAAIRMPRRPPGRDTEANALSTCGSLAKEFPHERIHVDGFEWAIMDSR